MAQTRLMPTMERFARAMINGAQRRGYDLETVFRALEVEVDDPVPGAAPPAQQQIDAFYRTLDNTRSTGSLPDLSKPLHIDPVLFFKMQKNIKWLVCDDFYGLTTKPCKIGTFLFITEMILGCDTLGEALEKAIRFYRALTDDIRFSLVRADPIAEFRIEVADPGADDLHFLAEWQMIIWHRFSCWLLGDSIPLTHAEFGHPMASPLEEYQRMFTKNCSFDNSITVMRFYSRFLDKYNVRQSTDFQDFVNHRFELVFNPGVASSMASRIEVQLEHHFKNSLEFLSMEDIAGEYNVSSQTVRRRLEDEGTSFRQIKDKIRRKVAMKWLQDSRLPISEVAMLSGFADANGLSRAVKTWTGESPSEFRARWPTTKQFQT